MKRDWTDVLKREKFSKMKNNVPYSRALHKHLTMIYYHVEDEMCDLPASNLSLGMQFLIAVLCAGKFRWHNYDGRKDVWIGKNLLFRGLMAVVWSMMLKY